MIPWRIFGPLVFLLLSDVRMRTYPLCFGQWFLCHHRCGRILFINLLVSAHARRLVHPETREANNLPGGPVTKVSGLAMSGLDGHHLFQGIPRMRPCCLGCLNVWRVLGGENVSKVVSGCRGEESWRGDYVVMLGWANAGESEAKW